MDFDSTEYNSELALAELALKELKEQYNLTISFAVELDSKARAILSSASLILTLFGALNLALPGQTSGSAPDYYLYAIVAIFAVYLVLLVSTLFALLPDVYKTPFPATKKETERVILQQESILDAQYQLIVNYIGIINDNQFVNNRKALASTVSIVFFALLVVLLITVSFAPILI